MSRWRKRARQAILAALAEAEERGLDGDELVKHVRAAYPFGQRECHPYKIWLSEFRLLVQGREKTRSFRKRRYDAQGQSLLFASEDEGGGA